jgi:hypothetical protein
MNPKRIAVIQAALRGEISASNLTMEELVELEAVVQNLVTDRILEKAMADGKIVFSGVDQGVLN